MSALLNAILILLAVLGAGCEPASPEFVRVATIYHHGGDLSLGVFPNVTCDTTMPLTIYLLEESVEVRSDGPRGARSATLFPDGRFVVRHESSTAGHFDEILFSEHRIPPGRVPFTLTLPSAVLPKEPFRVWIAGAHSVSIDDHEILPRGCQSLSVDYPYLLVEPMRSAAQQAAEADDRTRQRDRSPVSVRVPRGGSPMVSSMSAAA